MDAHKNRMKIGDRSAEWYPETSGRVLPEQYLLRCKTILCGYCLALFITVFYSSIGRATPSISFVLRYCPETAHFPHKKSILKQQLGTSMCRITALCWQEKQIEKSILKKNLGAVKLKHKTRPVVLLVETNRWSLLLAHEGKGKRGRPALNSHR
jgi:hypothetical protein